MLRFNVLGFPVTIEPFFWLSCFLLGGGLGIEGREGVIRIVIWTVVVFISILIHELGHAFAARKHGAQPEIRLQGLGGVTIMRGGYFNRAQSIFVSAAGPLASLALGGLIWLVNRAFPVSDPYALRLVGDFLWVNFFWTAINLLPILPLDGGQIVRELLGPRRVQIAIGLGVVCSVLVGIWAFKIGLLFLGVLMLMLAYLNFQNQGLQGGVMRD